MSERGDRESAEDEVRAEDAVESPAENVEEGAPAVPRLFNELGHGSTTRELIGGGREGVHDGGADPPRPAVRQGRGAVLLRGGHGFLRWCPPPPSGANLRA
jgi:hypothetical protein